MRSESERLNDIVKAIDLITDFISEGQAAFFNDDKTQSAVLYQFEIVGEATKHLSKQLKADNPQVPWSRLGSIRDKLIHVYFTTDPNFIWQIASTQIQGWKSEIELILRDLER